MQPIIWEIIKLTNIFLQPYQIKTLIFLWIMGTIMINLLYLTVKFFVFNGLTAH
uniref:Uncharacterized protein n=1 Tax=uncultured bacterium contig00073 TaxID=1181552 RepID=A0A806JZR9_9BACT|nr:hypothetical protein [uncultured bacterium contig00073]